MRKHLAFAAGFLFLPTFIGLSALSPWIPLAIAITFACAGIGLVAVAVFGEDYDKR